MGHYASEMGYYSQDEFDYQAVNGAGFLREGYRSTKRTCPICFCLVEGKHAMSHLAAMHAEQVTQSERGE